MNKEAPRQQSYIKERLDNWREEAIFKFLSVKDQINFKWIGFCYDHLGPATGKLAELLYGCKLSKESQQNIEVVNQHLEKGSAVVYFNHISLIDGPLITLFLLKNFGGKHGNLQKEKLGGPISAKHCDRKRSKFASIYEIASLSGIQFTPVLQHYDMKYYREEYEHREAELRQLKHKLLREYTENVETILNKPGGIFMTAPGETRSKDGTLQKAKHGLAHLNKRSGKVELLYVPLAIIPKGKLKRESVFGKLDIKVGKPYTFEEIREEAQDGQILDDMMLRLAKLLPKNMRGVYRHLSNESQIE